MAGSTITALNAKGEGSKWFPWALPKYVFPWTLQRPPMTRPEVPGTEKALPRWLDGLPSCGLTLTKPRGNLKLMAAVALRRRLTSPNAACFLATAPLWSFLRYPRRKKKKKKQPSSPNFLSNGSRCVCAGGRAMTIKKQFFFFRRYLPVTTAVGLFTLVNSHSHVKIQ